MRKSKIKREATQSSKWNSTLELLVEFWFVASAVFRTLLIGVSMFQQELSQFINLSQAAFVNILSFSTLFYLGCAFIHFVFSIVFVAKEKENGYVIPSLSAAIVMFIIIIFI